MLSRVFSVSNLYAVDHLYGICQKELLKLLAWQVQRIEESLMSAKTISICFSIFRGEGGGLHSTWFLRTKKAHPVSAGYLDSFSIKKPVPAKRQCFHDKETAEKMLAYAKEKLGKEWLLIISNTNEFVKSVNITTCSPNLGSCRCSSRYKITKVILYQIWDGSRLAMKPQVC